MAIDVPVRATPARQLLALEWIHAQMPDRYWEPADSDWFLAGFDAVAGADSLVKSSAGTRRAAADACLRQIDREIDRRLRDVSVLVAEPELMNSIADDARLSSRSAQDARLAALFEM
jgi:hypothetical protein